MPERAENRFAREFMEIARRVAAAEDGDHWVKLCDLVEDYREGKRIAGIDPRSNA